jgi:hypothetical protein
VLLTLLVSWWSFAADLSGTTWGIPQVSWDPTGAFVFDSIEDSVTRYDVRTGQTSTVEDAATSFIALSASRSSPDGKAMAEVKLNVPTETEGNWKGATFTPPKSGNHQLVIQRGGRSFVTGQADSIDTLSVYWSPDGRYVAWVVSPSRFHGMDGSSLVTASVGAAGPQVQVLGMPEVLKVATSKVTAVVEKQGALGAAGRKGELGCRPQHTRGADSHLNRVGLACAEKGCVLDDPARAEATGYASRR